MRRPAEGIAAAPVRQAPGGAKAAPKGPQRERRPARRVSPAQRGQGRPETRRGHIPSGPPSASLRSLIGVTRRTQGLPPARAPLRPGSSPGHATAAVARAVSPARG